MSIIKTVWLCASKKIDRDPFTLVKANDKCRIYEVGGLCVVAFDGSNDLGDWINNLKATTTDDIHNGFYDSFAMFADDIEGYLTQIGDYESVIFTGHSRGGALATVAASFFVLEGVLKSASCITFGAPKVGDRDFRDNYNRLPIDHTGYRNGWDIVTYLPPSFTGYRHVGKLVKIKRPWYRKFLMTFRIKDHFVAAYDKALKKQGII